jgi:hypothetical protein
MIPPTQRPSGEVVSALIRAKPLDGPSVSDLLDQADTVE